MAKQLALTLEELAIKTGLNKKTIRVRTKEEIIKQGLGKADAQVIWKDGPVDWALDIDFGSGSGVHYQANDGHTLSFYST